MRNRNALTLIEVLIVVIIMAVLAATIIPQFSESTKDAKDSELKFNLHTIRSQIEMYKAHHLNNHPTTGKFVAQMTEKTDVAGDAGDDYGPYIQGDMPENPFNGSNVIVEVEGAGTAVAGDGEGWQYDPATGDFYPNNAEWYLP